MTIDQLYDYAAARAPAADLDADLDAALVQLQLAEWWERQRDAEVRAKGLRSRDATLPFSALVLQQLRSTIEEAASVLNAEGSLAEWIGRCGHLPALLFFQRLPNGASTDDAGAGQSVGVWGIAERELMRKAPESETLAQLLRQSTAPFQTTLVPPRLRSVQFGLGDDRWFYPQVTCRPDERTRCAALGRGTDAESLAARMLDAFAQLVLEASRIERESRSGKRNAAARDSAYEQLARESYLAAHDFSDPAVRVADLSVRQLFLFHSVASSDDAERSVLTSVGARLLQAAVAAGWPEEHHVAFFALRTRRNEHCVSREKLALSMEAGASDAAAAAASEGSISFRPRSAAAAAAVVPLEAQLRPFVLLPGDSRDALERRFLRIVEQQCPPFGFDGGSADDEGSPVRNIVARFADRRLPRTDGPLYDPFPTRLYVLAKDEAEASAAARQCLARADGVAAWRLCGAAAEAEEWLSRAIERAIEGRPRLWVFPQLVFRSLAQLRSLMPASAADAYSDGVCFLLADAATAETALQPSLDDLLASRPFGGTASRRPPRQPATAAALPFSADQLRRAFAEADRAERLWIRPEAFFAANPPEESPDKRGLPRLETVSDDGERRAWVGRAVAPADYGYWLGSEYRVIARAARESLEQRYGGDVDRWLALEHGIDGDRMAAVRASFAVFSGARKGSSTSSLSSSTSSLVVLVDDEEANAAKKRERRPTVPLETRTRVPLPGDSHELRTQWQRFCDERGEEFVAAEYGHDSLATHQLCEGQQQQQQPPSFLWNDRKRDNFGGRGAYELCVYLEALEACGEDVVSTLAELKRERRQFEKDGGDRSAEGPPFQWAKAARSIVEAALEAKAPPPPAPVPTLPALVYGRMQRFYESRHSALASAASPDAATGAAAAAKAAKSALSAADERARKRREAASLYALTSPISNTVAQRYLREVRGLRDASEATIERSPYVRFHPAYRYSVKKSKGGKKGGGGGSTAVLPALVCFCADPLDPAQALVGYQVVSLDGRTACKVRFEDQKANPAKKSRGALRDENAFFFVQPGRLELVPAVYLAEGPETAWSVAASSPDLCVFCSFGVGNFARFADSTMRTEGRWLCLVLDRDADARKRAAVEATVSMALQRARQAGWRTCAVQPDCDDGCKDFNEVLLKHGIAAVRSRLRLPFDQLSGAGGDWKRYVRVAPPKKPGG